MTLRFGGPKRQRGPIQGGKRSRGTFYATRLAFLFRYQLASYSTT